jgi:phosphoribosylformylglycinamidine synthase
MDDAAHVTGASLRRADSVICMLGETTAELGGSVYARIHGIEGQAAPATDSTGNLSRYRAYHEAVKAGIILSCHDISEGGLGVAAAEMAFSLKAGLEIDLPGNLAADEELFSESPGRFLIEVAKSNLAQAAALMPGLKPVGRSAADHLRLRVHRAGALLIDEDLAALKALWKNGLTPYY